MMVSIPRSKLSVRYSRSGGPGGQNVNKVETKVEVRLSLADLDVPDSVRARIARNLGTRVDGDGRLSVTSSRFRLRSRNLRDCLERLEAMLDRASKPDVPRIATKPTRASEQRRRNEKGRQSLRKRERTRRPDED